MLGEMIGELHHRSTGTRVIRPKGQGVIIEESFQGSGTILGFDVSDIRSVSIMGMLGEGPGVIMTKDEEVATYTRHGIGWLNERGGHTVRAAMLFKTAFQKLARLNKVIVVSEAEEDENGNLYEKLWEWK